MAHGLTFKHMFDESNDGTMHHLMFHNINQNKTTLGNDIILE